MHRVHPVYHLSMLELHTSSMIPNQTIKPLLLVEIDSKIKYEIVEIIYTKLGRRRYCKLLYLVHWSAYEGTNEETAWLPANELSHAPKLVNDCHKAYLHKPGPDLL
jgi:hypothetical protein